MVWACLHVRNHEFDWTCRANARERDGAKRKRAALRRKQEALQAGKRGAKRNRAALRCKQKTLQAGTYKKIQKGRDGT